MQRVPVSVRRLSGRDAGLAERLNTLLATVFEDPITYQPNRPGHDYLEQLLAKDDVIILIVLNEGELVGGLVAYEFPKLESARREVYIYDLAVAEAHRRRGVAIALITDLRQIARARGAWVIFV